MKKDPKDLTVAEFDRLNAGLKKYANDELFAEEFATKMGPKGTLELWTQITEPTTNRELFLARREQLGNLQQNIGLTLATATQSDTAAMSGLEAADDRPRGQVDRQERRLPFGRSGHEQLHAVGGLRRRVPGPVRQQGHGRRAKAHAQRSARRVAQWAPRWTSTAQGPTVATTR